MSLWHRFTDHAAHSSGSLTTFHGTTTQQRSWAEVTRAASGVAHTLRQSGVEPGAGVGCVLDNTAEAVATILGVWWAGATLFSFPAPARGIDAQEYLDQLSGLTSSTGVACLVVEDSLAAGVDHLGTTPVVGFASLASDHEAVAAWPDEDGTVFVQYSSGSTSAPKGCTLTGTAIAAQFDLLTSALEPRTTDSFYTWLPLSHDMGLFGGLLWTWTCGLSLTMSSPTRFLRAPYTWFDEMAAGGHTLSVGPNFGVAMAVRAARRRPPQGEIRLRHLIVGSDPIEKSVVDDALTQFGPLGLAAGAIRPAYGMAEATLAVSMTPPATPPRSCSVSLAGLHAGEVRDPVADEQIVNLVSSGRAIGATTVRIAGGGIGEILIESPSMCSGYRDDPVRTNRAFPDGRTLHSGDIGFIRDGDLFVMGRDDDMIAVGGRNVYTTMIELRIADDARIRSGTAAIVDVTSGSDRYLAVVSEPENDEVDFEETARTVRAIAASVGGIGIRECIFLQRGSVPKSPSGKIQRFRCRTIASDPGHPRSLARVVVGR